MYQQGIIYQGTGYQGVMLLRIHYGSALRPSLTQKKGGEGWGGGAHKLDKLQLSGCHAYQSDVPHPRYGVLTDASRDPQGESEGITLFPAPPTEK